MLLIRSSGCLSWRSDRLVFSYIELAGHSWVVERYSFLDMKTLILVYAISTVQDEGREHNKH